ncbi:ABC transporter substrate-binding protein [Roseibium salinum]|nr:ABC transporter substrate-binding protein [Roseibium salinum]
MFPSISRTRTLPNCPKKVKVHSTPIANTIHVVGLNYDFEPFQDANVRKAVAYAIPYKEIFETAAYGRGRRCGAKRKKSPAPNGPASRLMSTTWRRRRNCSPPRRIPTASRCRCRSARISPPGWSPRPS